MECLKSTGKSHYGTMELHWDHGKVELSRAGFCELSAPGLETLGAPGVVTVPAVPSVPAVQAQRRSREHSRSASALSISGTADEKSEPSDGTDQRLSYYSNGGFFTATATGTRTRCGDRRGPQLLTGLRSALPRARKSHISKVLSCAQATAVNVHFKLPLTHPSGLYPEQLHHNSLKNTRKSLLPLQWATSR